jgi:hypothetical protein
LCINNRKQLAALGSFPGTKHLIVWKMEGPTDFRLIHQEHFNASAAAVWSDEDYVVIAIDNLSKEYEVRLISTTTFETERLLEFKEAYFLYDRGLLFVADGRDDAIRSVPNNFTNNFLLECVNLHRIMEAKTGQWIRNIYLKSRLYINCEWDTNLPVRLNSKFLVIATESRPSNFRIYDLEAIRNPSSKECLLTTITVRYCSNDDRSSSTTYAK